MITPAHPNERLARVEERVDHIEEEVDSISIKVHEMHEVLMQAKGVRWAVMSFSALIGFLIGVGAFLISLKGLRSIVLVAVALALLLPALAHGPAEWIQRGGYRNAVGELCCGERDCFEVEPVRTTATGYYLPGYRETIPFSEALPSRDGKYWRCQWGGARKCFFAPPPAM